MSEKPEANKEVLESIRDVLSGKEPPAAEPEKKEALEIELTDVVEASEEVEEEVLDLTQKVNEDGSITDLTQEETAEEAAPETETAPEENQEKEEMTEKPEETETDVLSEIDDALNADSEPAKTEEPSAEDIMADFDAAPAVDVEAEPAAEVAAEDTPAAEPEPAPEPEVEAAPEQEPATEPKPAEEAPRESVLSEESANAAKSSLQNLVSQIDTGPETDPSAPFRSGETVEDLVTQMLKPMMKEWLDNNLPKLVEDVVEREIKKIIPK